MNFFERILYALSAKMPEPSHYGWFHLLFFAIVIGLTIFICIKFKNTSEKTFRKIILIGWIVMFVFEIYKQLILSVNFAEDAATWSYKWYAFPYQLCSTPLYLLPFVAFLKEGKVRDAVVSFIATFALFGGIVTFIIPNDIFYPTIGLSIQTMVHHGLQIILGIFCIVYYRKKWNFKLLLKGNIVFVIMTAIALTLDLSLKSLASKNFNMFYLSPYVNCPLPIFNVIYKNVPYIVFLLIYIIGFVLVSVLIHYISYAIIKAVEKKGAKKNL